MEAQDYDDEDLLQTMLADHPDLLAGHQMNEQEPRRWMLVARDGCARSRMSGWHGRVRKVYQNEGTALIAFDSLTLLDLPQSFIDKCEEEGYSNMISFITTGSGLPIIE